MARVLFLQHDHVSPPGPLADRFAEHGYEPATFQIVDAANLSTPGVSVHLPSFCSFDAVVPLGSPWSVYDPQLAPWFTQEVAELRAADAAGVPVLGVCFGAQALAVAHGGEVHRAEQCEIGWYEVASSAPELVAPGWWFQYHFDAITPPPGSTVLATSPLALQAFSLRRNLGVQFHPEATSALLELWLDPVGTAEVVDAGFDPDELRRQMERHVDANRERAFTLVDAFLHHLAMT
jgi:GMP synthase-like glutamine amidotransferase